MQAALAQLDDDELASTTAAMKKDDRGAAQRAQTARRQPAGTADCRARRCGDGGDHSRRVSRVRYGQDGRVSLHDPDLDRLTGLYRDNGGHYWVLERDGQVVGASAWRRWRAKSPAIASCRNCSLSPARGLGMARYMVVQALKAARAAGYRYCYLETTEQLKEAIGLYYALGFTLLTERRGNTGHHGCNVCMLKNLQNDDM